MTVTVKLFATLRDFLPRGAQGSGFELEFSAEAKVDDVLKRLGVPPDQNAIILVNSLHAQPEQALNPGDVIAMFPPIAGG